MCTRVCVCVTGAGVLASQPEEATGSSAVDIVGSWELPDTGMQTQLRPSGRAGHAPNTEPPPVHSLLFKTRTPFLEVKVIIVRRRFVLSGLLCRKPK